MLIEIAIVGFAILTICIVELSHYNPPPLFGIYQKKNGYYYLKVAAMYAFLSLRKLKKEDTEEYGKTDKPQTLSADSKAVDAVYLNGASKYGDHLIVGAARRKNRLVDGFVYLKLHSKYGLLESPKLPDTSLYQDEESEEYGAEGIKLIPIEPMKKWKFTYEGKMKEASDRNIEHNVKVNAIWISDGPHFNFDKHMDPLGMAKTMAYEKWSSNYFKIIKSAHQTHYEQFGTLRGKALIDDEEYDFAMDAVRDHTFGLRREWRQFYRYAEHWFTTEHGDYFNVGIICMPVCFSRLIVGYMYSAFHDKIFPLSDCDFQLYQHGTNGSPPLDYAFTCTAGPENYNVQVHINECPYFYISKDWESKIYEGLCNFKVNEVDGWGATEWLYRNVQEKDVEDFAKR